MEHPEVFNGVLEDLYARVLERAADQASHATTDETIDERAHA